MLRDEKMMLLMIFPFYETKAIINKKCETQKPLKLFHNKSESKGIPTAYNEIYKQGDCTRTPKKTYYNSLEKH
jgi:hypothetical protein